MKHLEQLLRPNIRELKPYSSARDEYNGVEASVFLDANENPYSKPYNRYPDPMQRELKQSISRIKNVPTEHIFLGNGSDEAIDLLFRAFCEPRTDNVVAIAPTYGMYRVCADVNDVEYRSVLLDENFQLVADTLLAATDDRTKLIFLCSPNNPSGNDLNRNEMMKIVEQFDGLVVIDEAYIDFSDQPSFLTQLTSLPNVVVLQTFSKAYGNAAIRLGMAFASPDIINVLNKIKYPYNVNSLTQQHAMQLLHRRYEIDRWIKDIKEERRTLLRQFSSLKCVKEMFHTDANFFLARMTDAVDIYNYLVNEGIIVRNRHNVALCQDCLRVTVGTSSENRSLIESLRKYKVKTKKKKETE
ncbi:MAG: histidinol-phosphate transaminase [Mediterranea sp.]|jgi:histidinol-phosphate aminotransferase|nr:histidinol-phosphate transaminase [Mediterranea sp.]